MLPSFTNLLRVLLIHYLYIMHLSTLSYHYTYEDMDILHLLNLLFVVFDIPSAWETGP